jgi:glyoxylase-like metal-dependent hydrolase (beta-lactamase superfamily II)
MRIHERGRGHIVGGLFAGIVALGGAGCEPSPADDSVDLESVSLASSAELPFGGDAAERSGELPTADPFARGYEAADFPRVTEIAPGVFTWEQLRSAGEEWFTTVSLYVVSEDGVLVADGQGNLAETQRLVDHIEQTHAVPITDLVIGSDHGDHTAGNMAFAEGIRIYAHPRSDAALQAAGLPGATDLVDDQLSLEFGSREVELLYLGPAHTGGDLVVHLPEEGVLFMSEAYLHRVFPAMRSACPSGWVTMLERAQALDAAIPVPGHGFVDAPSVLVAELDVFRRAVEAVVAEGYRLFEQGLSIDEAMAQADFGEYADWSLVSSQGPTALRQIYAEASGQLECPAR